jgi:hypothetical protein
MGSGLQAPENLEENFSWSNKRRIALFGRNGFQRFKVIPSKFAVGYKRKDSFLASETLGTYGFPEGTV